MVTLLHSSHQVSWSAWTFDPMVIAGTFIAVSFYFYGSLTLRCFAPWRALAYLVGVGFIVMALVSPLDAASDRLLSMHMLQHVFMTTIGPPLVLLGLPPGLIAPLFHSQFVAKIARVVFNPVLTATLFVVNMWLWHVPPVYVLATEHTAVHILMHAAFTTTGFLYWWPIIQPSPATGHLGDGSKLLYLFATGMPMALLAVMFFASGGVIYDYYDQPVQLWGIDPMDDQQVAGLIMGALGELASFVAITLLFFRFLDREEQAASAVGPVPHRQPGAGPTT